MLKLRLERGDKDKSIYIGIEGDPSPKSPFYTVHISALGELREDVLFSTILANEQISEHIEADLSANSENTIFCVYLCSEPINEYYISYPNVNSLIAKQYFSLSGNSVQHLESSVGELKLQQQSTLNLSPLYADDASIAVKNFQIVTFCAGAYIYNSLRLAGITITPIKPGLSNISAFEAIQEYLLTNHTINVFENGKEGPWLELQPTFAVHFNHVKASSAASALAYTGKNIGYIRNILALDRGDKPYPFVTLLLDRDTGDWGLYPSTYDFRGNLAAPLFPHSGADQIERLRPIVEKNPFARLVLDLYVQSLSERDRSYKFFRQWSLLEMMADKYVNPSDTPLKYSDGSIIYREPGKPLTTKNNAGKVYELLRSRSLPQINQGCSDGSTVVIEGASTGYNPGGKIISLYMAVAASYAIRNAVAHDGFYDYTAEPKNEKQEISRSFYLGVYGFLGHAVECIALPEIYKEN